MNYHFELNFSKLDFYRAVKKEASFASLHQGCFLNHTEAEGSIINKN